MLCIFIYFQDYTEMIKRKTTGSIVASHTPRGKHHITLENKHLQLNTCFDLGKTNKQNTTKKSKPRHQRNLSLGLPVLHTSSLVRTEPLDQPKDLLRPMTIIMWWPGYFAR